MDEELQLCGFKLGHSTYVIPLSRVQECLSSCIVTPIPRSPEYIGGLVNYRGNILVAIDVKKLLGKDGTPGGNSMNIVVKSEDALFCLEVDEVVDVIDVRGRMLNEVPGNIDDKIKGFVRGIYRMEDDLAILLNLDKVLNTNKWG